MTSPYFYAIVLIVVLWVLILPMRNGNYESIINISAPPLCSYPTYEEWKTIRNLTGVSSIDSSYPTYEEWKLYCFICFFKIFFKSSYPTYEEWKLFLFLYFFICYGIVLILPMRNGNHIVPSFFVFFLYFVLILPMRNGNVPTSPTLTTLSSFLSYLWGMETLTFPKYLSVL